MDNFALLHGDCLEQLRSLPSDSLDSLVTDPPAGISFMGKDWDHHKGGRDQWIAWLESVMRECLRVLKPGAHGLVWALPRTSHWTATALENAGFEVRDVVTHLFGTGFPKSLDVSKAIDKAHRGVPQGGSDPTSPNHGKFKSGCSVDNPSGRGFGAGPSNFMAEPGKQLEREVVDAAKRWQGFGTALKPAHENWILVRKPCSEKTVAANVLRWGTGALAIDASRIGTEGGTKAVAYAKKSCGRLKRWDEGSKGARNKIEALPLGRWPANLVLGDDSILGEHSRYFYCAKPSRRERNAGCEGMPEQKAGIGDDRPSGQSMQRLDGRGARVAQNSHPTVKPITLMRYLIRMVTPPEGVVLDPFTGSGSTGVAALREGFSFIGIEQSEEYVAIAESRMSAALEGGSGDISEASVQESEEEQEESIA